VWPPEVPFPFPPGPTPVADAQPPVPAPAAPPPVYEQGVLDFVWRDFDWRSVGETAFNAAADIGDSVGAFSKGFGLGVVDMATGAVVGAAQLTVQGAKLAFGSLPDQIEAGEALYAMGSAAVQHTVESGRFLVYGVSHPGDVLDAMAQLGIQGSAEQLGRSTAAAEGTVSSLYGMAGPVRSIGRRLFSEADEAAAGTSAEAARSAGGAPEVSRPLTSAQKGAFGEQRGDVFMEERGFVKRGSHNAPGPGGGRPKPQGIDGVYENTHPPPKWVVAEAKYGESGYGVTRSGKQLSDPWTDARLDHAVGRTLADQIRLEGYERWELRVDSSGKVTRTKITW
jgi:hypothetical protein